MTIEQIFLIIAVIGIIGSAIEKVGTTIKNEKVENVGKAIEAATADIPKLLTNLFAVFKAKK